MDSSSNKDASISVEQLVAYMATNGVVVPRIDHYKDIFTFVNEFDMSTRTLPDNQKLALLVKAFPPGRLYQWYETKIKPLIGVETWDNIKKKIIQRYSETEDRDRHMKRINTLKFEANGSQKLFDYVEDFLYSFQLAMPKADEETQIRYLKSKLPSAVFPILLTISNYSTALTIEDFMTVCRRYDTLREEGRGSETGSDEKIQVREMMSELKKLIEENKQQKVSKPVNALKSQDQSPARSPTREMPSSSRYAVREDSPKHERYHTNQYRPTSPNRGQPYLRTPSPARRNAGSNYQYQNYLPNYQQDYQRKNYHYNYNNQNQQPDQCPYQDKHHRRPMDKQDSSRNNDNYLQYQRTRSPPLVNYPNSPNHMQRRRDQGQSSRQVMPFDNERYYERFGMPPGPCANCGQMHWYKHCLYSDHLN